MSDVANGLGEIFRAHMPDFDQRVATVEGAVAVPATARTGPESQDGRSLPASTGSSARTRWARSSTSQRMS